MNLRKIIREEVERVFTDIHGKSYSPVEYTGVVIEGDEISRFESELANRMSDIGVEIPSNWNSPDNYHMTITLGELSLGAKLSGVIGREVELEVNSIGVSDDAIAAGVSGLFSKNENQHITVAFKKSASDSNEIIEWIPVRPFKVVGYIREINKADGWGKLRQR